MKRLACLFILILFAIGSVVSQEERQTVGLVLSGGGAKGMAHIGLIRALEENEIPIDYIAGTSMGAIVGSMYAMGYTPDQMEELIASEKFRKWYKGTSDNEYNFYFKERESTPSIFSATLDLRDSLFLVRPKSTSLVNPEQMNLGFVEIFSGANAVCNNNFDSLFVPFRCVASDVFEQKKEVVLSEGDLGEAIRASMSFPFVFKPIKIGSVFLYDGGVYNNFPLNVMMEEFHPDFVIGSIVSGEEPVPDEYDLYAQIKNMVIQSSDYSLPDSLGVRIEYKLEDVGLLDFHRIHEVQGRGYDYAAQFIDSIKSRVTSRRNLDSLNLAREEFKSRIPELKFNSINVIGVSPSQAEYVEREFWQSLEENSYGIDGLRAGYFRVLSDHAVNYINPRTWYNKSDSLFGLKLDVGLNERPELFVGGGLSSNSTSQLYCALSYQKLREISSEYLVEGQIGKLYKNLQGTTRFDWAGHVPMSLSLIGSVSDFGYFNKNFFFSNATNQILNKQIELFGKVRLSLPILDRHKAEFSLGGAIHKDYYSNSPTINLNSFKYDKTRYAMLGASVKVKGSTLDNPFYPTLGSASTLIAQMFTARERYMPMGNKKAEGSYRTNVSWLQMSYHYEKYAALAKKIRMGSSIDLFYSTRDFAGNYTATMMQAGTFAPTQSSLFMYDTNFRANEFFAIGFKPIYVLNSYLHLRGEAYCFVPIHAIKCDDNGQAFYSDEIMADPAFLTEVSAVAKYGNISCNLFLNTRSTNWSDVTFGITVGIIMLNERFIE